MIVIDNIRDLGSQSIFFEILGSSALGEIFNPARDCSDIVDHLPEAKDGFYWINLPNKTTHQVLNKFLVLSLYNKFICSDKFRIIILLILEFACQIFLASK